MLIDDTLRQRFKALDKTMQDKLAAADFLVFDFDGVFTDNTVYIDDQGREMVRCNRSDTYGLQELKALNVPVMILSTEKSDIVRHRANKVGIEYRNNLPDKAIALREEIKKRGLNAQRTIYVGNDVNDESCFELVGLSIAVTDAFLPLRNQAEYVTLAPGGNGAVREVLTLLLLAKQ